MIQVIYPRPHDFSHVTGTGTDEHIANCRSKIPVNAILDKCCLAEVAAIAEAELMRMIAGKIYIVRFRSIDDVSIADDIWPI